MTEFISSKFGKPMLVDNDNFLYMEVRQYQDRIYWKCIHAKKYNCKGKATTRHGKVTSQSLHSHPSDLADVRFRRLESQAKARAQENETIPPRTILGDTSRMLACKNQLLPKTDKAFLKSLQRARRNSTSSNEIPVPMTCLDAATKAQGNHLVTSNGERFLEHRGPVTEDRNDTRSVMLFMSAEGRQILRSSDRWHGDGTFSTAPRPFSQIYIVFGVTMANRIVPGAYALLPDKSLETYTTMFHALKIGLFGECAGDASGPLPAIFMCDHEYGPIRAFSQEFPSVDIKCCHFHWKKNLHFQLGNKGCLTTYNRSEKFQDLLSLLTSLAFVPTEEVHHLLIL